MMDDTTYRMHKEEEQNFSEREAAEKIISVIEDLCKTGEIAEYRIPYGDRLIESGWIEGGSPDRDWFLTVNGVLYIGEDTHALEDYGSISEEALEVLRREFSAERGR